MLIVVLAYVLGAIPCGYLLNLLVQRVGGTSPRLAVFRTRGLAIFSSLADMGKGALVVWAIPALAERISVTAWGWLVHPFISPGLRAVAALLTAVLGHVLSVYVCGWGGRGISMAFGAFLVLTPVPSLCALAVFAVAVAVTRTVWKGALAAMWTLPAFIWYFDRLMLPYQLAAFGLAALSVVTHYHVLRHHERR